MNNKIINDPVHGFIEIYNPLILNLIEHHYFQRLKRISQTALTSWVYPGALHTRFHHALGAMHLMNIALKILKNKGIFISKEEHLSALIAILLHDIGHGPFSHTLENTILKGINHEKISLFYFELLNKEYNGELSLALKMFKNEYNRTFFYELISSQLDTDRLDYIKRDSFFTGVSEGNIGSERILTMINVVDEKLVVEEKGIYSVEKYLTSRMFMYWQVYFHKTSTSAEVILLKIFKRVKELLKAGIEVESTNFLSYFFNLNNNLTLNENLIYYFSLIDDSDIYICLKQWQFHKDKILSLLSKMLINRLLPYSQIYENKKSEQEINNYIHKINKILNIKEGDFFVNQKELNVIPYELENNPIRLLTKNNDVILLQDYENSILIKSLSKTTSKFHLMIPKNIF